MIKICHITSVHSPNDNRIFYKECISLKQKGYDVALIAPADRDYVQEGISIYGIFKQTSRIKRFLFTSIFYAFRRAISVNADLYHFHDVELLPTGLLLKIFGKRVVYDVHENNPAALLSKPYLRNRVLRIALSRIVDFLEIFAARFFDAIITARPDVNERFVKSEPVLLRNFPVLPNYNEIKELDIAKKKYSVIYVGGMSEIRGTVELIQAFSLLDSADLWLLGRFESPAFEKRCRGLEGWKNVNYIGIVEPNEIFAYIKGVDIGIVTFLPKPNHITTLATKPFEYMACGLPMIMSNFNYWKDFFADSSLYVDPFNSNDIADKIKFLLADKALREDMASQNIQLAHDKYNWNKEVESLFEVYDLVLKS